MVSITAVFHGWKITLEGNEYIFLAKMISRRYKQMGIILSPFLFPSILHNSIPITPNYFHPEVEDEVNRYF